MKKTKKKLVALCIAIAIMMGMGSLTFASGSTTVTLKSYYGGMNDLIGLSNVVGTGNMEYIEGEDMPTYLCNSPAEVTILEDVTILKVQKVTDENLEKAKMGEEFLVTLVPFEGEASIYDPETGEWTIVNSEDLDDSELVQLTFNPGAKATLEKGVYIVHCRVEPTDDYIDAIVIVDGGNTDSVEETEVDEAPVTEVDEAPVTEVEEVPMTEVEAVPTASNVLVNGEETAFDAYNISGNNYFKLRDLAYALNGSDKQFDVTWDGINNAILLTSNSEYTTVGGEMEGKAAGTETAISTSSKILLDGEEIALTAYNIGDNNYFKLRDIGQVFDFGITWDGMKNTITIDTATEYTE